MSNDGLDDNLRDQLVAIGKGAAGAVPIVGGLVAEIVGAVIPGQRADRIASYLRSLAARVSDFEAVLQRSIAASAEKIDLIEEGGFQAARATSTQRVEQITEAVARGLKEGEADVIRRKRLLVLFGQLDEDEVALLIAYGRSYGGGDRHAFDAIHRPDYVHMQSPQGDIEKDRLYRAGAEHLLRLDLLQRNYGSVKKGQLPEFDTKTGTFKHSVGISSLGRLMLSEVGLQTPFDERNSRDR